MFTGPGNTISRLYHTAAVSCVLLVVSPYVFADPAAGCSGEIPAGGLALQDVNCMSDEELQTFRGGFIHNNQIIIGFGFERIVRVDGEVQEHILAGLPSLNLANNIQLVPISRSLGSTGNQYLLDVGSTSPGADGRLATDSSISGSSPQMQLVPSTSALQDMMSNVIQNNLDDKVIDQVRVINIDLMGLGGGPRIDPHNDLHSAIFESLGQ